MKKDEKTLFNLILGNGLTPNEAAIKMQMNHKRLEYILGKWVNIGFYDYGVSLDHGWFIPYEDTNNRCKAYIKQLTEQ